MEPTLTALGFGIFGGLLVELLKWYRIVQEKPTVPPWAKEPIYWIVTILMILAGGILAYGWSMVNEITFLLAMNIGASAPLIIAGLANKPPTGLPGGGRRAKPSVREFLGML